MSFHGWTDDPVEDAANYDSWLQEQDIECEECQNIIHGDYYKIHGDIYCPDCIENFKIER